MMTYIAPGPDEFCCLGVLCDITDPSGWELHDNQFFYQGREGCLNDPIDYGLNSNIENVLIHMNDGGKSFQEIADFIEKKAYTK
jgi:hypothetical protein